MNDSFVLHNDETERLYNYKKGTKITKHRKYFSSSYFKTSGIHMVFIAILLTVWNLKQNTKTYFDTDKTHINNNNKITSAGLSTFVNYLSFVCVMFLLTPHYQSVCKTGSLKHAILVSSKMLHTIRSNLFSLNAFYGCYRRASYTDAIAYYGSCYIMFV